jgi:hypothetical protein
MKYTHRFNSRLTCTVEIADHVVEPGEPHIVKTLWSEKPKKKNVPEYVRWMHLVNDRYSKQFNLRIMYVFQLGPKFNDWQVWGYSPEAPPQRLEMSNIPGGPADLDRLNLKMAKELGLPSIIFDHQTEEKA